MTPGEPFDPFGCFVSSWLPNVVLESTLLSPADKLVFGRLLQYKGHNVTAWPSHATLAKACGISERQAYRALAKMIGWGLVRKREQGYVFLWHSIYEGAKVFDRAKKGTDKLSGADCQIVSPGGDKLSVEDIHIRSQRKSEPLQLELAAVSQASLPAPALRRPAGRALAKCFQEPECSQCGDTGWRQVTRRGVTAVERCDHRARLAVVAR